MAPSERREPVTPNVIVPGEISHSYPHEVPHKESDVELHDFIKATDVPNDLEDFEHNTAELDLVSVDSRQTEEVAASLNPEEDKIALPDMSAYSPRGSRSETTQTSETNTSRKRNILLGIGAASIATLAASVAVIAGAAKGPSDDRTAENTSETTVATATANQTAEADPLATAKPSAAETNDPSVEILKQTTSVEAMNGMSIEAFAELPYADRFAYMIAKRPKMLVDTPSDNLMQQHPDYIAGGLWQPLRLEALGDTDPVEGSKIYSAMQLYTTTVKTGGISPEYQATVDSIKQSGGNATVSDQLKFQAHGEWQQGVDRQSNPIDFVNITYSRVDFQGNAIPGSETTAQAVRMEVQTLDGNTYISYPQAYTIQGKASPDSHYPY